MKSSLLSAHGKERHLSDHLQQFSFLQDLCIQSRKFPRRKLALYTAARNKLEELITTLVYSWLKTICLLFSLRKFYYNTGIDPQSRVLDLLLALVSSLIHGGFPLGKRKLKSCITVVLVGLWMAWHQWMMLKLRGL